MCQFKYVILHLAFQPSRSVVDNCSPLTSRHFAWKSHTIQKKHICKSSLPVTIMAEEMFIFWREYQNISFLKPWQTVCHHEPKAQTRMKPGVDNSHTSLFLQHFRVITKGHIAATKYHNGRLS